MTDIHLPADFDTEPLIFVSDIRLIMGAIVLGVLLACLVPIASHPVPRDIQRAVHATPAVIDVAPQPTAAHAVEISETKPASRRHQLANVPRHDDDPCLITLADKPGFACITSSRTKVAIQ